MLQSPVQPSNYSLRVRRKSESHSFAEDDDERHSSKPMAEMYDEDADLGGGGGKGRSKSRRELPAGAVATLKAWLLSPEHFTHPYPTPQDQAMLMQQTGIDKKQLKNWFTNARRRIWKPMLKKQIEEGKLTATGAPGLPGSVAGLMIPSIPGGAPAAASSGMDNPHSIQAMRVHYQQAIQEQSQQQQQTSETYGGAGYSSAPATDQAAGSSDQYYVSQPADASGQSQPYNMPSSSSIGTLPQLSSSANLSKTDSHAVLMELFARDQDLVRQATESARLKAESKQQSQGQQGMQQGSASEQQQQQGGQQVSSQHPMKAPSQASTMQNVPTLNSWPHFSSITSLNNLGTMPGVKSITSLSGADLASKGNVNKMGNLAQVKSMESMGKNDSYAFLEVFFGDRSSTNLSGMAGKDQKTSKQAGDEDNEIGLSLEDESPSQATSAKKDSYPNPAPVSSAPQPAPMSTMTQNSDMDAGTLKRAYDDALAARGLISVSRSSEKLTDLVLPAKIQRTLSQEFINKQQRQQQSQSQQQYGQYAFASSTAPASAEQQQPPPPQPTSLSHQYPGQQPREPQEANQTDTSEADGRVQVSTAATCALCSQTSVDTQLRPCGHMFHERCLKPSLQHPMGPPKCPVDSIAMQSALLAIPCDDPAQQEQPPPPVQQQQQQLQKD